MSSKAGVPIPTEPFFKQYEMATGIFAGELVEVEDYSGTLVPDIFVKNKLKEIKKVKIKVEKAWKGKGQQEVTFLAYYPKRYPTDLLRMSLMAGPFKKGLKYLVFLREEGEVAFAHKRSGFEVFFEDGAYENSKLVKALDALSNGRTMKEASALISESERKRFEKQSSKK